MEQQGLFLKAITEWSFEGFADGQTIGSMAFAGNSLLSYLPSIFFYSLIDAISSHVLRFIDSFDD
jgi:hypothetical protein